jgi:hypothetical protein
MQGAALRCWWIEMDGWRVSAVGKLDGGVGGSNRRAGYDDADGCAKLVCRQKLGSNGVPERPTQNNKSQRSGPNPAAQLPVVARVTVTRHITRTRNPCPQLPRVPCWQDGTAGQAVRSFQQPQLALHPHSNHQGWFRRAFRLAAACHQRAWATSSSNENLDQCPCTSNQSGTAPDIHHTP